jgi:uncharacterized SAM-binding protein YcdF (DUF218 family)
MRMILISRRTRLLKLLGLLVVTVLLLGMTGNIWLPWIGHWLAMPATSEPHRVEAIFVHGSNPDRTLYGIELYHRGLAPVLWHTGYASGQADVTRLALQEHVPSQAFHYLITTSTWSDGEQIAAAIKAGKLHDVLIVTDWWHSRRALCATEQQLGGYSVSIDFEPIPSPAGPDEWWDNATVRRNVVWELVKLGYYALRYGMTPWGC